MCWRNRLNLPRFTWQLHGRLSQQCCHKIKVHTLYTQSLVMWLYVASCNVCVLFPTFNHKIKVHTHFILTVWCDCRTSRNVCVCFSPYTNKQLIICPVFLCCSWPWWLLCGTSNAWALLLVRGKTGRGQRMSWQCSGKVKVICSVDLLLNAVPQFIWNTTWSLHCSSCLLAAGSVTNGGEELWSCQQETWNS